MGFDEILSTKKYKVAVRGMNTASVSAPHAEAAPAAGPAVRQPPRLGKNGGIRQAETEYSKLGIAKIETSSRHFC
jgi:hypothetical protein